MEQITLPTKTKIAAWWMLVIGGISLIAFLGELALSLYIFIFPPKGDEALGIVFLVIFLAFLAIVSLLIGLSLFLPAVYLLKRKRWAQKFTIMILPAEIVGPFVLYFLFNLIGLKEVLINFLFYIIILVIILVVIIGIPFILLLLDRKNFEEIAS